MLKIRWNWKKRLDLLIRCWNSNTHLKVRLHLVVFVNGIQVTSESMLVVGGVLLVCFVFVFCYCVHVGRCVGRALLWNQRLTCGHIPPITWILELNSGHQVWVAGVFTVSHVAGPNRFLFLVVVYSPAWRSKGHICLSKIGHCSHVSSLRCWQDAGLLREFFFILAMCS